MRTVRQRCSAEGKYALSLSEPAQPQSTSARTVSLLSALIFAATLVLGFVAVSATSASAANLTVTQCNSVDGAGLGFECDVTVTNNLNLDTGATSSEVIVRACTGAPDTTLVCAPVTTTNATDLVNSINQCNFQGNGGGGSLVCRVNVTNNITGNGAQTAATVNQCNGSADGDGMNTCSPFPANTTSATVTQCNGSSNGGGSTVDCTVASAAMATSALPFTINQCNDSENGGGSVTRCSTSLTNRFFAPAVVLPPPADVVPTPTVTPTESPAPVPVPVETVAPVVTPTETLTPAPAVTTVAPTPVTAPSATAAPVAVVKPVAKPVVKPKVKPAAPVVFRKPPAIPSGLGGGAQKNSLTTTAALVSLLSLSSVYALRRRRSVER